MAHHTIGDLKCHEALDVIGTQATSVSGQWTEETFWLVFMNLVFVA